MVGWWSTHDISLKSWRWAKGMWSHTEQGIQYSWIMHAVAAESTVPVPGQVKKHLFFPSLQTHPHTDLVCVVKNSIFIFALDFTSPLPNKHTGTCFKSRRLNSPYLSRRRRWRLSPGWPPPSRSNGPCERDEPWECTELTSRLPFSPPALLDAPPAATAWRSRPGTAARRAR